MILKRAIQDDILKRLDDKSKQNKVIIIYGARQVGKTTLIKELKNNFEGKTAYFNCDFLNVQNTFAYENASNFHNLVQNIDLLILDEAQRIKNIGLVLKILIDTFPDLKIIATGSSSFDLANAVNEPLTGRKHVYKLYPLSFIESGATKNYIEKAGSIEHHLRFGFYPALLNANEKEIVETLDELTGSYLFKDILSFQNLKKPEVLSRLLLLLAFQVGSEVSYTELSNKLGVDHTTVQNFYLLT